MDIVLHTRFLVFIISTLCSLCRTGMAGVPGTASAIFSAVKEVGANVIMISQVYGLLSFLQIYRFVFACQLCVLSSIT